LYNKFYEYVLNYIQGSGVFKHEHKCKGSGVKSSVKIQLQYDLLTGEFIHCELKEGCYSDASYLETLQSSIVVSKYPKKLIKYLKEEQGINTKQIENGIYYIENTDIKTQIIVNNKNLNRKESEYLKLLQINQEDSELLVKWINEYTKNTKDPLYLIIMNVLTEINPNSIVEA